MTVHSPIETYAITAVLNFLKPMKERPVSYQYDPPPGIPMRTGEAEPHVITIHDARMLEVAPSLDAEGFALIHAPSAVQDFRDATAIATLYYPEVERLIGEATGAGMVINFEHNIRNATRADAGEAGIRRPVDRTHNDFTARSGCDRARRELETRGLDPEILLRHRFAIVNLWRPIARPVLKSPLALGDARTIAPADLIVSDLVYRDRVGETYALQFSPEQRWYRFPRLTPEEAILIKGFDSD